MQLTNRELSQRSPNGTQALKGVSFDMPSGMFGVLGPDCAALVPDACLALAERRPWEPRLGESGDAALEAAV